MKNVKLLIFRLIKVFLGITSLIAFGTSGYMFIEKWEFLDSLLMSVITLTTVGYGYAQPLSAQGKIFTIIYILISVILFLYLASVFVEYLLLINFGKLLSARKMEKTINKLKNHYIICGYGRTGSEIAKQIKNENLKFIIIDKKINPEPEKINFIYIQGDATDDETLEKAGIKRAKGLFCALSDDVDNLYITLSARNLNPKLKIVSRCVKQNNELKFKNAGANTVISPFKISARRMVTSVTKPLVVDFLDVIMHTKGQDLELKLEQFQIKEGSLFENKTIFSSELRKKTGVIVIAINRNESYITNPQPEEILKKDDYLIVLGSNSELAKFEDFV